MRFDSVKMLYIVAIAGITFQLMCSDPSGNSEAVYADNEFRYCNVVGSMITPGNEDTVNTWFNTSYLPTIWNYPLLKKVIHYKLDPAIDTLPEYWTFYYYSTWDEMDTVYETEAYIDAKKDMDTRWKKGEVSSAVIVNYEKIKGFEKAGADVETPFIKVVGNEFVSSQETELNTWFNTVYIPLLMKYEGLVKVVRYKKNGYKRKPKLLPTYLTIYYYPDTVAMNGMESSVEYIDAVGKMVATWNNNELTTIIIGPCKTLYAAIR